MPQKDLFAVTYNPNPFSPPPPKGPDIFKQKPKVSGPTDPTEIKRMLTMAAARHGVDASLVMAVAQSGSNFNPGASKGGKIGVLQLSPDVAKKYGAANPYDTAQNIEAGVRRLKSLVSQSKGNVAQAISAYGSGDGPQAFSLYNKYKQGHAERVKREQIEGKKQYVIDPEVAEKLRATNLDLRDAAAKFVSYRKAGIEGGTVEWKNSNNPEDDISVQRAAQIIGPIIGVDPHDLANRKRIGSSEAQRKFDAYVKAIEDRVDHLNVNRLARGVRQQNGMPKNQLDIIKQSEQIASLQDDPDLAYRSEVELAARRGLRTSLGTSTRLRRLAGDYRTYDELSDVEKLVSMGADLVISPVGKFSIGGKAVSDGAKLTFQGGKWLFKPTAKAIAMKITEAEAKQIMKGSAIKIMNEGALGNAKRYLGKQLASEVGNQIPQAVLNARKKQMEGKKSFGQAMGEEFDNYMGSVLTTKYYTDPNMSLSERAQGILKQLSLASKVVGFKTDSPSAKRSRAEAVLPELKQYKGKLPKNLTDYTDIAFDNMRKAGPKQQARFETLARNAVGQELKQIFPKGVPPEIIKNPTRTPPVVTPKPSAKSGPPLAQLSNQQYMEVLNGLKNRGSGKDPNMRKR